MNVAEIARALGGDVVGRDRIVVPGPGHSRHDRSLSISFDQHAPDGFVVNSFAGDDWRCCREHVRGLLQLPSPSVSPAHRGSLAQAVPVGDQRTRVLAQNLWNQAVPAVGTRVEDYLGARGVADEGGLEALRFHPTCPFRLDGGATVRLPAMLAAMVNIYTNRFQGIHRTALNSEGTGKADLLGLGNPKKMLGRAAGACVKLTADEDVTLGLHVAEGIETALACMAMGFYPMWAALSAGGIASFPVLAGIEAITVFADNDENGAGMKAARACAACWISAGRECLITIPPCCGTDWADRTGRL